MRIKNRKKLSCCNNHLSHRLVALTSAKLSNGLSSSRDYKRTRQGTLATLLLYLYKYNVVYATTMYLPHVYPPCFYFKATMPYPCALMSYSLISITMCVLCVYHKESLSLDVIPNPNSF